MISTPLTIFLCGACFFIGIGLTLTVKNYVISDQPIKLSYTLECENGKCDTTYKASTR